MEVTGDNFSNLLPLISKSIHSADFVAVDTEFSGTLFCNALLIFAGFSLGLDDKGHDLDLVEDRY